MVIRQHTFTNGCKLIWEKSYNSIPLTSIYIFCDIGSIHEPAYIRGAAHFIEHMCFKGTTKIPLSKSIFAEYNKIGAQFNASTQQRCTEFHVRCQDQYVGHCIDILSDMLLNSTFKRNKFAKEEHVVIEENIKNADNVETIIDEMMMKLLYKGSPYEWPIDTLDYHKIPFDYDKVVKMYREYYKPSNMILSIGTNLEFDEVVKLVKKTHFMKKQKSDCLSSEMISQKTKIYLLPSQTEIQYNFKEMSGHKMLTLLMSFRTCNIYNKDKYKLGLLRRILSGTLGSRMTLLLREDNGLTYTSYIYDNYYEHSGEFSIFAELDNTKLIHNGKKLGVLPLIVKMLNDLCKNGVTTTEMNYIHTNFQGSELFKSENNELQTFYNGFELLTNSVDENIVPYNKLYDVYYKNIGIGEINSIIRTYLKKSNMNVCIVGSNLVGLNIIKRECNKLIN